MPETFYTSSQYYNLFFQLYFNRGLSFPLKEKKTQSKCMFRLGDDDIESPYKKILDTFDFFV